MANSLFFVIVCDGSSLDVSKKTGVEHYAQQVLGRLLLLTASESEVWTQTPQVGTRVLSWPFQRGWLSMRWVLETQLRRPDVVWIPGRGVPWGVHGRVAVTVHDLAAFSHPELYHHQECMRQYRAINQVRKRADLVICVSEATRQEWLQLAPEAHAKTIVTPLGVDVTRFFPKTEEDNHLFQNVFAHLPTSFHLMIGRVEEKKGLAFVLDLLETGEIMYPLVWAGSFGYGVAQQMPRIARLQQAGRLILCAYVPDEQLPLLLRCAISLWFPSRAEGFGLPVLEAFASRVPVLTSDLPVLEEVGGEARFCVSDELHFWVEKLRFLETQTVYPELLQRGVERAHSFSWQRTAEQTLYALRELERGVY